MAKDSEEAPVRLSVLDRLITRDLKAPEPLIDRAESLRLLKAAVRRDLEWLLNTRWPVQEPFEGALELGNSVYCYGLPDICSMNLTTAKNRTGLARVMEAAVARFEPRLIDPRVSFVPAPDGGGLPHLNFVIEGTLAIEPMPEHVRFDTVLKVADGHYQVRGDAVAG